MYQSHLENDHDGVPGKHTKQYPVKDTYPLLFSLMYLECILTEKSFYPSINLYDSGQQCSSAHTLENRAAGHV